MISSPPGTEMFQFPGLPPHCLCIQQWVSRYHPGGVAPFGHPRITACWQLPAAFRSHPRPSSALGAKASTVRPYSLGIPDRSIETTSESAGSCSISGIRCCRMPSITFDSSSLLCSCPGTAQAHRLSSGAPTLTVRAADHNRPARRPAGGDKNAARPGRPGRTAEVHPFRWTCLRASACCELVLPSVFVSLTTAPTDRLFPIFVWALDVLAAQWPLA